MNLVGTPDWNTGYKALLEMGGICELMITHEHFEAAYQVAKKFPDLSADTLPRGNSGGLEASRLSAGVAYGSAQARTGAECCCEDLGTLERVTCELLCGDDAPMDPRMCRNVWPRTFHMFASNFHVERLFVTLPKLFRLIAAKVDDYTPSEQDAMFAGTAERVYRI